MNSIGRALGWFVALCALMVSGCSCGDPATPLTDGGTVQLDAPRADCGVAQFSCGGAQCCEPGAACLRREECCPTADVCGSACCGAGETCEGAICHVACAVGASRCHDGSGAEVCCGDGELCVSDRCFLPTTACSDFFECARGEHCETALGVCLPLPSGPECLTSASGGDVRPTELWRWTGGGRASPESNQVVMTPLVANLTDDNGDGSIDTLDTPDVVFSTFDEGGNYALDGVLRAVHGDDGRAIFDVLDTPVDALSTPAIGDLDGDGEVEIVACGSRDAAHPGLVAFDRTGGLLWTNDSIDCLASGIAIANLDGVGDAEVFVRYQVVDSHGVTLWSHACLNAPDIGRGEHFPCNFTTAADLDGDGLLEVVGGNVAYHGDGSVYWDRSDEWRDGFPAVADLDLDGDPEIVVVQSAFTSPGTYEGDHFVRALHADGTPLWGPIDLNGTLADPSDVASNFVGGGGPPTLANLDSDPEPEIALAGAYGYVALEGDGTLRWRRVTHDRSSRKTGSSVFDFDGDGRADAVYNDEYWLRVYDGDTGEVRFCECNTSATLYEYPVIADVNNDGHAEIVVASNDYFSPSGCPSGTDLDPCTSARIAAGETRASHGVRVFAAPMRDWAATRRIWNQHSYHITNVTERGAIPAVERPNWSAAGLNDFRLNTQPGALFAPNLVPLDLGIDLGECSERMTLNVRIRNDGWSAAVLGASVDAYVTGPGGERPLPRAHTTRTLLPGESEILQFPAVLLPGEADVTLQFRVHVVGGDAADPWSQTECRVDDNDATADAACDALI